MAEPLTFTAPSGAEVVINTAPWRAAKVLKRAIERELAVAGGMNLNAVLLVDSSEAVDAALWPCLERCLYKGQKIINETFDAPDARKDYYDILMACIKENLGPLADSLLSKLEEHKIIRKQAADVLKSTSQTGTTSSPAA